MNKTQIFLSISILINIFLVGYLTGNQLHHKEHHKHPPRHHMEKGLHQEIKQKRHELFEIMAAPEFNEAKFDEKVLEMQKLHDTVKAQMPARLKRKVQGKTQEQRIKVVKRIKRKHRHRM